MRLIVITKKKNPLNFAAFHKMFDAKENISHAALLVKDQISPHFHCGDLKFW